MPVWLLILQRSITERLSDSSTAHAQHIRICAINFYHLNLRTGVSRLTTFAVHRLRWKWAWPARTQCIQLKAATAKAAASLRILISAHSTPSSDQLLTIPVFSQNALHFRKTTLNATHENAQPNLLLMQRFLATTWSEAEKKSDKTKFTLPSLSHFREIGGSDNYRWKFRAIPFGYSFTKNPVETMPISRDHKQKIAIRPNESQKPVVKNISFSPPD